MGGGVYIDDSNGETIEIYETFCIGNTAGISGGALSETDGLFTIRNGSYCGNLPDDFGDSDTTQDGVCFSEDCTDSDGDAWIDQC